MEKGIKIAAIDLGAESGRVILVTFSDQGVVLDEVHRFPNSSVRVIDHLHWNILSLFKNITDGLGYCANRAGQLDSLGLDTWGVDYALLDADGSLLGLPFHYRDGRTDGMLEAALELCQKDEIFDKTGIQFMQINTLYQLLSMRGSPQLDIASTFLMIPDLLNYWLSGEIACEFTDTTTTQMYDQRAKSWAYSVLGQLGLPQDIYPEIIMPGEKLGKLLPSIADEIGLGSVPVIVPATHDTGSAVAAIPVRTTNFAYISSGTWSLVGMETDSPVINDQSLAFNFTNEGGVDGTVRLLKNVTGLWLVQECRRIWAQDGSPFSYDELVEMAQSAEPFISFVDPDADDFLRPLDMPNAIRKYCARTNQVVPETKNAILRCIFESLALKYLYVLENLETMTGRTIDIVHIIGGGSQNELLNQLTANFSGKQVIAGPVEATALGNSIMQAVGLGYYSSVAQGRKDISRKLSLKEYFPQRESQIDEAYGKFKSLLK